MPTPNNTVDLQIALSNKTKETVLELLKSSNKLTSFDKLEKGGAIFLREIPFIVELLSKNQKHNSLANLLDDIHHHLEQLKTPLPEKINTTLTIINYLSAIFDRNIFFEFTKKILDTYSLISAEKDIDEKILILAFYKKIRTIVNKIQTQKDLLNKKTAANTKFQTKDRIISTLENLISELEKNASDSIYFKFHPDTKAFITNKAEKQKSVFLYNTINENKLSSVKNFIDIVNISCTLENWQLINLLVIDLLSCYKKNSVTMLTNYLNLFLQIKHTLSEQVDAQQKCFRPMQLLEDAIKSTRLRIADLTTLASSTSEAADIPAAPFTNKEHLPASDSLTNRNTSNLNGHANFWQITDPNAKSVAHTTPTNTPP